MVEVVQCPPGPHTHSVAEVCALIGCESEEWFRDRVRSGEFPFRRIVRQLRFTDDDIREIIDKCTGTPRIPAAERLVPTSRRRAS